MINEYSKERVFVRRYRIIVLNAISEKLPQRKSFLSRQITNCWRNRQTLWGGCTDANPPHRICRVRKKCRLVK